MKQVWLVSDPLCSWCWAFAPQFEEARARLSGRVAFDLLLGGINVGATHPLADVARARFTDLWNRVTETTGQTFSHRFPGETFVYNSTRACVAVHALRRITGRPPFDYLYELQRRFFIEGEDVTQSDVLADAANEVGVARAAFLSALRDPALEFIARDEFDESKRYGTHALPSVLVEDGGRRRLFAGGWMTADQLAQDLGAWLSRG